MKTFYLTTAIDYVNSLPHIGTAYEKVAADTLARFQRLSGNKVHFQMGNDEHSVNVRKEADRLQLTPKVYCDGMRQKFEAIWKTLDISYDGFIQTSEPRHHAAVAAFLKRLQPGDIYLKDYEGWYCESCEAFFTEKDLVDGKCPNHKSTPQWLKETNHFFRLSNYQDRLLEHYQQHPEFILPEIRRNEVLSFVRTGLQDISISRPGGTWGIPFPEDTTHSVYVWFDALINYLTAAGFEKDSTKSLWPADLHIVGKDITRFHCVIWPAMLMSAGLPLPKTVFGHGFVFLKGEKMSKTLGNIVTPLDIVPQYGADALRYYLLRESSFGSDGDFTWNNFIKRYNSDLANDLGNLLNRTLGMAMKYLNGKITKPKQTLTTPEDETLKAAASNVLQKMRAELDIQTSGDMNFHKALAALWAVVGTADKYIDTMAPWKLAKEGRTAHIQRVLYNVLDTIRNIAILVSPFMPGAAQKIWDQLGLKDFEKQNFKNVLWAAIPSFQVSLGQPIFPRIEASPSPAESSLVKPSPSPAAGEGSQKEKKMDPIDITDFQKIDLRVAEVKQAEKVEGADRLLKLQVEIGGELRQIVSGIAQHYTPEQLVGKKVVVVANLKPAKIRGVDSNGMLLAATDTSGLSILLLDRDTIVTGTRVK